MKLVIGLVAEFLGGKETCGDIFGKCFAGAGFTSRRHRFSDILRETLTLWEIPHGRPNEQLMARIMCAPAEPEEGQPTLPGYGVEAVIKHRNFREKTQETLAMWNLPQTPHNEFVVIAAFGAPTVTGNRDKALPGFGKGTLARAVKHRLEQDTSEVGMLDGVRWLDDEVMIRGLAGSGIIPFMVFVEAAEENRFKRLKRNRDGEAAMSREEFRNLGLVETEIHIREIGSRADLTLENNGTIADFEILAGSKCRETLIPLLAENRKTPK